MPDEPIIPPAETPAPEAAPAPTPIEEVTILTPQAAPVDEPAVVAEPEPPAPEPAAEPVAEEVKPELHTDTPTLLSEPEKPEEKKPDEKPAVDEKKPVDAVEVQTYEPFTLPDGVPVDEKRVDAFREIIGPHKVDQETAQKLVDLHTSTMQQYREALGAEQQRVFLETRKGWVDQIKADPVLGGSGFNTALTAAARMRDLLVPEAHRAEFEDFLVSTGAGDHPALMRMLHNAARIFDEPATPPIAARPVPDRGGNGKLPRNQMLYDHPSSRHAAGR